MLLPTVAHGLPIKGWSIDPIIVDEPYPPYPFDEATRQAILEIWARWADERRSSGP